MLKKDKIVCCRVPRCTNPVDKNYNIITLDTIILNILQHIQNPDIFNTWCIFKTLSNIYDNEACLDTGLIRTVYSGIFSNIQSFSDILREIKVNSRHYWCSFRHIQNSA